ncbi:MAG: ATP-dependent RNA helicase HrpA [Actinomycetota bacterium]
MTEAAPAPTVADLRRRLGDLTVVDADRLRRRLDREQRQPDPEALAAIADDLDAAGAHIAMRRAAVPDLRYPGELPVTERRHDLLEVLRGNQVVVVAGETGSGKSTQLPKLLLETGRGVRGMIAHTQPRRLAARSVAERIAHEVGTDLGGAVGYAVRFTDQVSDRTLVKVMTDGLLLAEIQRDPLLRRYDAVVVDEAHERSLNIDFLLGYLHRLLPRRRDLQVVITSATIDTERFAEHYDAPVVEVSGRTYPVEVRYRPFGADVGDDRDQVQAIGDAVVELWTEGTGDVLVFCSGEREIRDAADHLRRMNLPDTEVLPLYARLSASEQHKIFRPHPGRRRVVVATNVAETSLTVPGIEYVVDSGTARISRYSRRLKVQRLPIEQVSQASANQRAGRSGRVAPGICIRLYDEDGFLERPEFTEPEILRTNLASVVLQMAALKLGEVDDFPFVEPPDRRSVADAVKLLEELGAFDPDEPDPKRRLTQLGRRLSRLPLDPRLGRMVLEAEREGCVREVLIIATALSIQDPRERPADQAGTADELHRRFEVEGSDFLAFLRLWDHARDRQRALSGNQFRKLCRAEHLHHLRIREWQDLERQLRRVAADLGIRHSSAADDPDAIHRALLSGLLSQIGVRDGESKEYRGTRNARFSIGRGSSLAKQGPRWVMVGELVETNRLWGRVAAQIRPEWAEALADHLVKRSYGDPEWDAEAGRAVTTERVTLYGLPIVVDRTVGYDRVEGGIARDHFLHHALVERDTELRQRVVEENRLLFDRTRERADRARRGQHLVPDEVLFDFYDRRVGDDVVSRGHFDRWWKRNVGNEADLLRLTENDLIDDADELDSDDFPDHWAQDDLVLDVSYEFDPGSPHDGVTVHVPLEVLNRLRPDRFDWQVPGLRDELVVALLRSLPKVIRRRLLPLADRAAEFSATAGPDDGPMVEVLSRFVAGVTGDQVSADDWRWEQVPPHLVVRFEVDRGDGTVLRSEDLDALRRELRGDVQAVLSEAAGGVEASGLSCFPSTPVPQVVETVRNGQPLTGYPALVDEGDAVSVRVLDDPEAQRRAMIAGTRRLILLALPSPRKAVAGRLGRDTQLLLARGVTGRLTDLLDDAVAVAIDQLVHEAGGPVWTDDDFERLLGQVRPDVVDRAGDLLSTVAPALDAASRVRERIDSIDDPLLAPSIADIEAQLDHLVGEGFLGRAGSEWLPHLARYLEALTQRTDRLVLNPRRDLEHVTTVAGVLRDLTDARARVPEHRLPELDRIGWLVEELRVSLFAQQLGTSTTVSAKRLRRSIAEVVTS